MQALPYLEISLLIHSESFFRVMQVNLGGTFFLAQAASNQMKKQASGGYLLFTSSVTGHQAHKDLAAYGMRQSRFGNAGKKFSNRTVAI